jgi:KaiC/GvpD/RAD55 family RecA-like ATPase
MDKLLYGGFSRGELNIFAGGSGSGKSLVMMNIALNWLQMGLSGVYISLELSEELTSLRTDAMLTSMSTRDIRKNIDDAHLKIRMSSKKSGQYRVKGLPAQSNVNDIRSYIKEVQIQTGIKVDFVMIDYLDLVMPVSVKVNPNDQFIKDKYVSEELRNLAKDLGVLMVTASQLNRSAVEEIEFDHSHIAGGISKINTADNVFGIFTSRSMRERGKYQIQCMKSRSSTGVGQKIDLEYNIETMRITDEDPDGYADQQAKYKPAPSPNDIMSQLKPQSTLMSTDPIIDQATGEILAPENKRVIADVQGSKLKSLLNSLKK